MKSRLVIWLLVWTLSSCVNKPADVYALDDSGEMSAEIGQDVAIYYSDSAIVRIKVSGPIMEVLRDQPDPQTIFPQGVRMDFYDRDQSVQSVLTAKYGIRLDRSKQVIVRDNVVVTSVKNEKLETEELTWDEHTESITTQKFVKISTAEEVIYGYGLEADQGFNRWVIKAVTGRIATSELKEALE